MRVLIRVEEGTDPGREFTFDRPDCFLVGRAEDAHLRLPEDDRFVSRRHFVLEIAPPNCYLADLGSRNGTFVNGLKASRAQLSEGDEIRIGATLLRIRILASAVPEVLLCKRCEKRAAEPPSFLCAACEAEAKANLAKGANPQLEIVCKRCGERIGARANADGRAAEFASCARYLCQACAAAEQQPADIARIGPYEVLRELGRGGFGVVYLGRHSPTGRLAALKKTHRAAAMDQKARKMFQREISILEDLQHANIVRLMEHGVDDSADYFASEYLDGGDAGSWMEREHRRELPPSIAIALVNQVLEGLAYAHEKGYVHRDIKPQNILLHRDGNDAPSAKLADFGLAKSFTMAGATFLTRPGEAAGSLMYMAPEQILSYRFVGPPADLYSLGVTLYYLLTGSFPYCFPSPLERALGAMRAAAGRDPMAIVLEDDPLPIRTRRKEVPEPLGQVVDKAIRKKPAERYASARQMQEDLQKMKGFAAGRI
jgi:serine/threonine-protein kinase